MSDEGQRPPIDLSVLDADPVRAERAYHDLRRDLVRFLEWWGCKYPEDAADEALFRGLKRLAEGVELSPAGPRGFIFGVAKFVAKESVRLRRREEPLDPAIWAQRPSPARHHQAVDAKLMLDRALQDLSPRDQSIILRYCTETDHAQLSRDLGVTPGNLRLIVYRIRNAIRKRVQVDRE
jgi:RNA polymerase sigma factor (sigma-70 family)